VISTEAQDLLDLHKIPQTAGGKNEVGERELMEENIVQQGGASTEKEGELPMDYGTIYPMPTPEPITLPQPILNDSTTLLQPQVSEQEVEHECNDFITCDEPMPLQEEERLVLTTEDSTKHPQQESTETIDSKNATESQGETPSKEIIGNVTEENVIEGPQI
jgi:hypothetical protein